VLRPWQIPILALRPWRLVKELDGYSDDECRRFMESITAVRSAALAAAFPIAIVLGAALVTVGASVVDEAGRDHWAFDASTILGRLISSLLWVSLLAISATGSFLPYAFMMRWAILRKLNRIVCPKCTYTLIGLPVRKGCVTCSECGEEILLAAHGWTEADVIAGARHERSGSPDRQTWPRWWILAAVVGVPFLGWVLTGYEDLLTAACGALLIVPMYLLVIRERTQSPRPPTK